MNDIFDLDSNQFNSHDMVEFATAIGIKLLELASETAKTKYDESSCCGDTGSEYEADIIIAHNAERFDIRKSNSKFLKRFILWKITNFRM